MDISFTGILTSFLGPYRLKELLRIIGGKVGLTYIWSLANIGALVSVIFPFSAGGFAMPLFPQALFELQSLIVILAVIGIVYGALVSMVQPDLKKLIAYSSVSHLGFVMLGLMALTPQSVEGAVYQMLNHGISTGALFFLVGMIYDRRHTRLISDFGGIAKKMPIYTVIFPRSEKTTKRKNFHRET